LQDTLPPDSILIVPLLVVCCAWSLHVTSIKARREYVFSIKANQL
jgi:hypothetical protein